MALAEPLTLSINNTTFTLSRTYVLGSRAEYTDPTGMVKVIVSHKYSGTRVSRLFRVEQKILLASGKISRHTFHTVAEYDTNETAPTTMVGVEVGVIAFLSASEYAAISKIAAGEY